MKVLVFCPLAPTTPRIYGRTVQSILTLEYDDPLDIVFARHDEPGPAKGTLNLMHKHNRARQMVLDGNYDAMLSIEADMIVPPNTLTRLAAVEADVAYGLYCSRHGQHQWLAFHEIGKATGKSIDSKRNYAAAQWGQTITTQGVGMGCTLIHRRVLEKIEFRLNGSMADDWYFALDCKAHGFVQKHDLGVVCGHILNHNSMAVVWPTINTDKTMFEIEPLEASQ